MGAPFPSWGEGILRGSSARVRIRASTHGRASCPRHEWLTAHPNVSVAGAPRQGRGPFALGEVESIVSEGLRLPGLDDYRTRSEWIRLKASRLHERHRLFVAHGAETLLDLFLDLDEREGPFTYRDVHGEWDTPAGGALYAWAFYFEGQDGLREVRRLRVGPVHPANDEDRAWDLHAAVVAAHQQWLTPCTRVVVREVSASDGSMSVHLDLSVADLEAAYGAELRPALLSVLGGDRAITGWDCPQCDFLAHCDEVFAANGALGQMTPGTRVRSVSAQDLTRYEACPAAWYYVRELKLPRAAGTSSAVVRGSAVHDWLRQAHAREVPCTLADLVTDPTGQHWLPPDAYEMAHPFLEGHIAVCPLADGAATVVASEQTFHMYDADAGLVVVSKPDLLLRRGNTLVLREVKSSETVMPTAQRSEISSRYLQVNLGLCVLQSLVSRLGCRDGLFELELLTPTGSHIWTWSTANATEMRTARAEVAQRIEAWNTDTTWQPHPSRLCTECDVQQWCSQRDAYLQSAGAATGAGFDPATDAAEDIDWQPGEPF